MPSKPSWPAEEMSIKPASPTPRAATLAKPLKSVASVDQKTIVPASPRSVASAASVAPRATVIRCGGGGAALGAAGGIRSASAAARVGPGVGLRPISMRPPPAGPETSSRAPAPTSTAPASTAIRPPRSPLVAAISPVISATSPPVMTISPPTSAMPVASTMPPTETRLSRTASACAAVRRTTPPSARIVPSCTSASASASAALTWIDSSPSPPKSTAKRSVAARSTSPPVVRMAPWFSTTGATSAMPPAPATSAPSLMIAPCPPATSSRPAPSAKARSSI